MALYNCWIVSIVFEYDGAAINDDRQLAYIMANTKVPKFQNINHNEKWRFLDNFRNGSWLNNWTILIQNRFNGVSENFLCIRSNRKHMNNVAINAYHTDGWNGRNNNFADKMCGASVIKVIELIE